MNSEPTVYVVDPDSLSRNAVRQIATNMWLSCRTYISASRFLQDFNPDLPGCLIAEVRIPDLNGFQLQQHLLDQACPLPVIFLSAHATVTGVVRAMRQGAVDFLEKPPEEHRLWECIQEAIRVDSHRRDQLTEQRAFQQKLSQLTAQEQQVLWMMLDDASTRMMAEQLNLSPRTIEARRAAIRHKLEATSQSELMRMALRVRQIEDNHRTPSDAVAPGPRFAIAGKTAAWASHR